MNVENIRKLADIIEQPKSDGLNLGFNMHHWHEEATGRDIGFFDRVADIEEPNFCGTVCCMGGTINVLADQVHSSVFDRQKAAASWLGLGWDDARQLFYPDFVKGAYDATRSQAAKVLRHLADTGKVDWSVAFAETAKP